MQTENKTENQLKKNTTINGFVTQILAKQAAEKIEHQDIVTIDVDWYRIARDASQHLGKYIGHKELRKRFKRSLWNKPSVLKFHGKGEQITVNRYFTFFAPRLEIGNAWKVPLLGLVEQMRENRGFRNANLYLFANKRRTPIFAVESGRIKCTSLSEILRTFQIEMRVGDTAWRLYETPDVLVDQVFRKILLDTMKREKVSKKDIERVLGINETTTRHLLMGGQNDHMIAAYFKVMYLLQIPVSFFAPPLPSTQNSE